MSLQTIVHGGSLQELATMSDDIFEKVRRGIANTGYPLELQVGALAAKQGWTPIHSIQYVDPETKKLRELDLVIYKMFRERRVEIRISCKASLNKQFVFFSRPRNPSHLIDDLKFTPVTDDISRIDVIKEALKNLRFFSEPNEAVNYTMLMGDNADREGKALLHDGMMSVVTSIHHQLLPEMLLIDERGTIYFFVVLLKGRMFDTSYEPATATTSVRETDYVQWSGRYAVPEEYADREIQTHDGWTIPFWQAHYWFGARIRVELIRDTLFEEHLMHIDSVFSALPEASLAAFGKPWTSENFPKHVLPRPTLTPHPPTARRATD